MLERHGRISELMLYNHYIHQLFYSKYWFRNRNYTKAKIHIINLNYFLNMEIYIQKEKRKE